MGEEQLVLSLLFSLLEAMLLRTKLRQCTMPYNGNSPQIVMCASQRSTWGNALVVLRCC